MPPAKLKNHSCFTVTIFMPGVFLLNLGHLFLHFPTSEKIDREIGRNWEGIALERGLVFGGTLQKCRRRHRSREDNMEGGAMEMIGFAYPNPFHGTDRQTILLRVARHQLPNCVDSHAPIGYSHLRQTSINGPSDGGIMRTLVTFAVFLTLTLAISTPRSSAQSNPDKITIGTISLSLNNLPIYVAQEKGFFAKENIFVEAVLLGASTRAIPALIGGSTHLSASSAMTTIRAIDKGAGLKIVGGLINAPVYDLIALCRIYISWSCNIYTILCLYFCFSS